MEKNSLTLIDKMRTTLAFFSLNYLFIVQFFIITEVTVHLWVIPLAIKDTKRTRISLSGETELH